MRKIINIVLILILVLLAVVFLSSCSLNIEDARVTSGENTIEVKNIDLRDVIFTADIYINKKFIQHYQMKSGQSEKGLLREKNVESTIQEYGAEEGFDFYGNIKLFVYTLSYELDTLQPNEGKIAVLGPCFIEIDGKMQLLNVDLPKDQYVSVINRFNISEEDKNTLVQFYDEFTNWRYVYRMKSMPYQAR
ncbi:hypothetical protein [Thermoactinomyces mirandus]|uniref:Uncharacterized protein n=1 Tax=Thermoactinomyces mirandus TaxID=2756294 RepID=A0A7W1XRP1_9BACL|nr:hypothetical protein [Thermoactinomyces mirandus]MBA4601795.1 hypothetical protein [Thermoactinomyces mirandus]